MGETAANSANSRDVVVATQNSVPLSALEQWVQDTYPGRKRAVRWIKGYAYHSLPKRVRFYGVLHWLMKTGLASSAPVLAWAYGAISGLMATAVGMGLFGANAVISFLDRLSRKKAANSKDDSTDVIIRFGDLLAALRIEQSTPAGNRDDAIRACLGIIEISCRQITKSQAGDLAVSLVLYVGNSRSRMKNRHRDPGNTRPVNREVDASKLLGHYVCQHGDSPRVVHDIKEFGGTMTSSPTQSKREYRSIFFYPIVINSDEEKVVKGFVSVDCKRPYAFYGNHARSIVVTCEPILSHISELLQEAKDGRSRQKRTTSKT